ncbi:GGDEF domain-containing protein [Desulfovibrio sp. PG-178-WT-4]|uniref:diguanylate cyclase n=1 Tax=Desulfovibrio porci TaxID=2605782 RepID=A0A6L5XI00_9BACT|nr:GGDEF domain-containing protein [Desulfovibrio porci]MSS26835.1 GGDEF domain-containing protein [Desulfovibrio porci]
MKTDSSGTPLSTAERKIPLSVTLAILATAISIFGVFYSQMTKGVSHMVLERSGAIFSYVTNRIPPRSLLELNSAADEDHLLYVQVQALLKSVRQLTAVRYLYTAKLNDEGKAVYVVDGLDPEAEDFRHIGDLIEPEVLPLLTRCLQGHSAHAAKVLYTEWGDVLPACEPIRQDGRTVGAIVMEFDAGLIGGSIRKAMSISLLISCVLVALFIFVTTWLLRRLSVPLYRKLAYTDLLTGINNRNAFELDTKRLQRSEQQDLTVLTCDLNMLKNVNDQRGHAAGDEYIISLARLLVERFRDRGETYRIGGDEFATLLRNADVDALRAEMDELHAQALKIQVAGFPLFFAYGIASFDPACDADVHDTMTRADAQMYAHKRALKQKGKREAALSPEQSF